MIFDLLPLVATCPLFSQPPSPHATPQDVTDYGGDQIDYGRQHLLCQTVVE